MKKIGIKKFDEAKVKYSVADVTYKENIDFEEKFFNYETSTFSKNVKVTFDGDCAGKSYKAKIFVVGVDDYENIAVISDFIDIKIPNCNHTMQKFEGTPATEDTEGLKDYFYCNKCKMYFEDELGTIVIKDFDAWKKGAGKTEKLQHEMIHHEEVEPTATSDGCKEYYECKNCGKFLERFKKA